MSQFRVTFFKRVIGDAGMEVDAPQRVFEFSAPDRYAAAQMGEELFRRERHLEDWSTHADRIAVELIENGGLATAQ